MAMPPQPQQHSLLMEACLGGEGYSAEPKGYWLLSNVLRNKIVGETAAQPGLVCPESHCLRRCAKTGASPVVTSARSVELKYFRSPKMRLLSLAPLVWSGSKQAAGNCLFRPDLACSLLFS